LIAALEKGHDKLHNYYAQTSGLKGEIYNAAIILDPMFTAEVYEVCSLLYTTQLDCVPLTTAQY
jgi:hypothetical protein